MFTKFVLNSCLICAMTVPGMAFPFAPKITSSSPLPQAIQGKPYSFTFSAQNGKPPYRWSTTTSLPPGLSMSTSGGLFTSALPGTLSGTPTVPATYSIGIVVVDARNRSSAKNFILVVAPTSTPPPPPPPPTITINPALPSGLVGKPYNIQLQIQGGTPPYFCTPDPSNNLATFGLNLTTDCWVRGIPTKTGTVTF